MVEYKCNQCDKTYTNKLDYTRHLQRKTPCSIKQLPHECIECGHCFDSQLSLSRHIRRTCKKNINIKPTEKLNNIAVNEQTICKIESNMVQISNQLNIITTHLLNMSQISNQSNVITTHQKNDNILNHLKLVSNQYTLNNFIEDIIDICPHKQNLHLSIDNGFNKDLNLDQHNEIEDSNKYLCEYCNKSYEYNYNLNKHLKICKIKANDDQEINKDIEKIKKEIDDAINKDEDEIKKRVIKQIEEETIKEIKEELREEIKKEIREELKKEIDEEIKNLKKKNLKK